MSLFDSLKNWFGTTAATVDDAVSNAEPTFRDFVAGIPVDPGTPPDGSVLVFNTANNRWEKQAGLPTSAHDLNPATGPHTGDLPESDVIFSDSGHKHGGGASGQAVDHGSTSGKGDDDHTQYKTVNATRVGILYETKVARRTTAGTAERWFSLIQDGDSGNSEHRAGIFIAPCDGKVIRVSLYPTNSGGSTVVRVDKNGATQSSKTETTTADTVTHFDFGAASFSKGHRVSVSTEPTNDMGNTTAVIVFELDWSTL